MASFSTHPPPFSTGSLWIPIYRKSVDGGGLSLRGVSSGSSYIAVTAYPSVYFIFVISESENDMYRSCIRSKFPIRGKIELQFANHGLHEK